MVPGIEQYYPIIGKEIAAAIAVPWKRAWIEMFVFRNDANFRFLHEDETGTMGTYDPSDDAMAAMQSVRELFVKQGKPWGRAVFELEATGSFRMHFDYDSTDADGFARYDHDTYVKWGSAQILWYEPPKAAKEGT